MKLEIISVRPMDKESVVRFFTSDNGIAEYIKKNFQDTGKLVGMTNCVSDDYSTQIKTLTFNSNEDYFDFANDKVLQYQETVLQVNYNKYHGITVSKFVSMEK